MTDFFADLEQELRRAHRRDAGAHGLSRLRPQAALKPLLSLAVVAALVAVVVAVSRDPDTERTAAPPPQTAPAPAPEDCAPKATPLVDDPIPAEIASTLKIFRDPRPAGELPPGVTVFGQATRLYAGAVELHPRKSGLTAVAIAADIVPFSLDPSCPPPSGPTQPGVCVYAFASKREDVIATRCFSADEIESAEAWVELSPGKVIGLAPDGAERVIFDFGDGTRSIEVSGNAFGGRLDESLPPNAPQARFEP